MEKIEIGKIVNVVGLRGEVKVYSYAEDPDRFTGLYSIIVGDEPVEIENVRFHKNMVILKLSGISDRNEAEKLKGTMLYITPDDLEELPEGMHYVRDLLGLDVVGCDGEKLGELSDILKNTAQDVYVISMGDGSTAMLPVVDEFVREINTEDGFIRIDPPEGLFDIYR